MVRVIEDARNGKKKKRTVIKELLGSGHKDEERGKEEHNSHDDVRSMNYFVFVTVVLER